MLSGALTGTVKACILVRVEPQFEGDVAGALEAMDSIQDAFPVLGQPEVVARVNAPGLENIGSVLSKVSEVEGVLVSETLLEIPQEAIR